MFRRRLFHAEKLFFILIILQAYFHRAFSSDDAFWCNEQHEESRTAIIGYPIQITFTFGPILQPTQSLVWTKADSEFKLSFYSSTVKNNILPSERHTLNRHQNSNNTFEMSILFTEENDTSTHTVALYENGRHLCIIFILNLTIVKTEPICETFFHKESKIQMSCQWVQVNGEDQARLMAGDHVLFEHETSGVTVVNGQYNITNKYSIFISPEKLNDASMLPTECVVFNSETTKNDKCEFPTAKLEVVQGNLTSVSAVFESCCIENPKTSPMLWYKIGGNSLRSLNFTEGSTIKTSFLIFLCGEETGNPNMILRKIGHLNLEKQETFTITVSTDSSPDQKCTTLTTNTSHGHSTITPPESATPSVQDSSTQDHPSSTSATGEENAQRGVKDRQILITVAAITSLAFTLSMGVQFAKCLLRIRGGKRYDRQADSDLSFRMNSPTSGHTEAESVEMAASTGVSRTGRNVSCRPTADREELDSRREIVPSCQEHQASAPVLPTRQDLMWMPLFHNMDNSKGQRFPVDNGTGHSATCDQRTVGRDSTNKVILSSPNLDDMYCSLDDVEGATANTEVTYSIVPSASLRHPNPPCDTQKGLFAPASVRRSSSSFVNHPKKPVGHSLTGYITEPSADLDLLYARPDMSQKTKKMTSSESDYDDPRNPGEELWQNILSQNDSLS